MNIMAYNSGYISSLLNATLYDSLYANGSAISTLGSSNSVQRLAGSSDISSLLGDAFETQGIQLDSSYRYFMQNYVVNLKNGAADLKSAVKGLSSHSTSREGVVESVRKAIDGYNGLLSAASDTTGASTSVGGAKLRKDLLSIASTYSSSLGSVGIMIDSKGYLSIDEDMLNTAIENGSAERFFSGNANYGFTNRLSRVAQDVTRNPAKYVQDVFPNIHYTMNSGGLLSLYL